MPGSIVQVVSALGVAGAVSISQSITVSAGNYIGVFGGGLLGTTATLAFTDDVAGSTGWTDAVTTNPANAIRKSGFCRKASGGTFNVTGTFGSSNWVDRSLVLVEISGLVSSSVLDQATGQHQAGATGANSITSGNPSSTTTANCFVLGLTACYNGSQNASAGTGFSAASGSPYAMDGNDVSVESKSVTSTGVYPVTFTPSGSGSGWDTHVLIFKEIVSGISLAWITA